MNGVGGGGGDEGVDDVTETGLMNFQHRLQHSKVHQRPQLMQTDECGTTNNDINGCSRFLRRYWRK